MKNIMKQLDRSIVGKKVFVKYNNTMSVEVEVIDIQIFYGKKRYLIAPVAGKGTTWIENIIQK